MALHLKSDLMKTSPDCVVLPENENMYIKQNSRLLNDFLKWGMITF